MGQLVLGFRVPGFRPLRATPDKIGKTPIQACYPGA